MFEFDAFHLARLQFAFTVSFHILFPAITIGLASYLVVLEGMLMSGPYKQLARAYIEYRH
ncbi:cytochrome ubiquinol oxidase subunit I, partial [Klebsiella pneumoniae]|uniref:cytochrome ubiquinol oxidase subunit I n=1 Tax=Klebsiella pneumoniae TaxID=573 RepID=UPI003969B4E3